MGKFFSNCFTFISKKEEQKQNKVLMKKAYPLGEKQAEFEDEVLNSEFNGAKNIDLATVKFVTITLREMMYNSLLDKDDEDYEDYDEAFDSFKDTLNNFNLTGEQLKKINKLNEIMLKAEKIEDLKF